MPVGQYPVLLTEPVGGTGMSPEMVMPVVTAVVISPVMFEDAVPEWGRPDVVFHEPDIVGMEELTAPGVPDARPDVLFHDPDADGIDEPEVTEAPDGFVDTASVVTSDIRPDVVFHEPDTVDIVEPGVPESLVDIAPVALSMPVLFQDPDPVGMEEPAVTETFPDGEGSPVDIAPDVPPDVTAVLFQDPLPVGMEEPEMVADGMLGFVLGVTPEL